MAPKFVQFVRSVEGRLVGRWDVGPYHYIGARLGTAEERANDKPIVWDTEAVTPLTQEFCARFGRELSSALRSGDLAKASEQDYAAWLELEQKREAAAEEAQKVAKKTAEDAAAPAVADAAKPPDQPPDPSAPQPAPDALAEPKPEKRK